MKKYRLIILIIAGLVLVLLMTYLCSRSRDITEETFELSIHGDELANGNSESEISLRETTELGLLKSGELVYSISNVQLISNKEKIPRGGAFLDDAAAIFPQNAENIFQDAGVYYPDFINPDGEFIDGVYLLLVDIMVTSKGAVAYTVSDVDEDGYPMGQFEDDALFHVGHIISLANTKEYINGETQFYNLNYYSGYSELAEDPLIYRLEPNDTTSFTVGFIIDDEKYGGRFNLSSLALCDIMGPGATYIELDLGVS